MFHYCNTMADYRPVNIDRNILKEIELIINEKKFFYRNTSEFVNSTLRDKLIELKILRLKEREIELIEKDK